MDNIYGCGNINISNTRLPVIQQERTPFSFALNKDKIILNNTKSSWQCTSSADKLIDGIYKTNSAQGGVLCCYYPTNPETIATSTVLLILFFLILTFCAFKSIIKLLECLTGRRPQFCNHSWCRIPNDGKIKCCCFKIPITKRAYREWRRSKNVKKLKCRLYAELIDDKSISDQCVICMDDYQNDSTVIDLKCGHHFHKECCIKWLDEHDKCPVCLQDFQKAKDIHNYAVTLSSTVPEVKEVLIDPIIT